MEEQIVTITVKTKGETCEMSDEEIRKVLVGSMQKWGREYPDAGYGARFIRWI